MRALKESITKESTATNLEQAEAALKRHLSRKTEMDSRDAAISTTTIRGQQLLASLPPSLQADLQQRLPTLAHVTLCI